MYIVLHVNHNVNVFSLGFIIIEPIISSGKNVRPGSKKHKQAKYKQALIINFSC
jgi:hypothetical protein